MWEWYDVAYVIIGVITAIVTMLSLANSGVYNEFGDYFLYVVFGLIAGFFWPIVWNNCIVNDVL